MLLHFIRHGLARDTGEGFSVVVHLDNHRLSILLRPQTDRTEITCGYGDGAQQVGIMRERLRGDLPAHAVTAYGDASRINRQALGIVG